MSASRRSILVTLCLMAGAALSNPAQAYVDLAPTIAKVIRDAQAIMLAEVVSLDRDQRLITLREKTMLKGAPGAAPAVHHVGDAEKAIIPRAIVQWAEPGAKAVVFSSPRVAIVCIGQSWYQLKRSGNDWTLGAERPELTLTYYGSVTRLETALPQILAGRDAILTMVPHGDERNVGFDLALNRMAYPGLVTVQRVRANLKMPGTVWSVSNNPAYLQGLGPVDEEELPTLMAQLQSEDPTARASAAEDLRQMAEILGASRTRIAIQALESCLDDLAPRVRCSAAATLLRITHGHDRALAVLARGLSSDDPVTRRDAATAAAVTGKPGISLVPTLAALLKDRDEAVRFAALEAIGTLGPIAAAARDAVVPLLDSPEDMIAAADALGRMGPRARPVPAQMLKMLASQPPAVRLAALRGMAQIGGKESLPAAQYIAREISTVNEIDAYNMVELLALLGPIASEPASQIRTVPMPNGIVFQAANWAMNAPAGFPWLGSEANNFGPIGDSVYAGFVEALGERLRPCALELAPRLMQGTAGNVPPWAYKILNAAPDESIATFAPHLQDTDKSLRERAAIYLARMGPPAAAARPQLQAAIAAATDEREKNLLAWCLHEISKD